VFVCYIVRKKRAAYSYLDIISKQLAEVIGRIIAYIRSYNSTVDDK
jgi:hypothetical protein